MRSGCWRRSKTTHDWCRYGDRSGVVIEPRLTDQWFVDAASLAEPAIEAVEDGDTVCAEELGEHLFRLDAEHPALVHLAPDLVGTPDPGLVRPGRRSLRRDDEAEARPRQTRITARRSLSSAMPTCSIPGSPRRSGRFRRWAGRRKRLSWRVLSDECAGDRVRHHLSSGSPG